MYQLAIRLIMIAAVMWLLYCLFLIAQKPQLRYLTKEGDKYFVIKKYKTTDGRVGRLLSIDNSASSFLEYKTLTGFTYIETIKKIIFSDLKLNNKQILVLGAGGFSLSAAGAHNNNFTYVDIDPNLPKIVQANFLTKIIGNFVAADARDFLQKSEHKYDVIVLDAFSIGISIPKHLLSKEYFELISHNLSDSGFAIMNMIINPTLNDKYSNTIDSTISAVFNNCRSIPITYANHSTNVVYVCAKNLKHADKQIYVDADNQSDFDILSMNSGINSNKSPTKP